MSQNADYAPHWTETADRVNDGDFRILGEDDYGDLWVPSRSRPDWWDRKFNRRNPLHWPYWWRSWRTRRIAFLERDAQIDGSGAAS